MLIAAMNPCPCGYLHDRQRPCICPPSSIRRYQQRISGPVLDRFDLFVSVPRVAVKELTGGEVTSDDPRQWYLWRVSAKRDERVMNDERIASYAG